MDTQQGDMISPAYSRSIWADMGEQFQLAYDSDRPEINTQIAWLQAHKDDFYKILQHSSPYISYVYEETKKRGLPAELALLPLVESEYDPNAQSKRGAKGVWQFMPTTAKELGLKSSHAYDARKDTIATTKAALSYLSDLHQVMQNDWLLALASYNYGQGNVQNAIQHQKKWYARTSFWSLHLPKQTEAYVPKVLALAAVIKNPAHYGITLPPISQGPQLASVRVKSDGELQQLAASSGVSMATIKHLNPAYRDLSATTKGAPNAFLIPIEHVTLAANQADAKPADKHYLLKTFFKEGGWLATFTTIPVSL